MKVAFLNLCHCDADVVSRVAEKLTKNPNFHMYIHVDKKVDDRPFKEQLKNCKNIFFIENIRIALRKSTYRIVFFRKIQSNIRCGCIAPNNLISEIIFTKNFI